MSDAHVGSAGSSSGKLRWGLLGLGQIAGSFAEGVQHSKTAVLAAVGSRSAEKAQAFAEKWKVERAHGSYEALLADSEVEAVYIATPHPQHAEWAIKAARAGKHVLCEKPIGVNTAEAMAIYEAAELAGVFCMEAFMYRCSPLMARLVELLRERAIGEVQVVDAAFSFRAGENANPRVVANALAGGGILDVGCYPVSLARLVAGAAQGKPFDDPVEVGGSAYLGATGVDEWAVGTLKFRAPAGDILANVRTGVRLQDRNEAVIYGTQGRIEIATPWAPMLKGGTAVIRIVKESGAGNTREITVQTNRWLYGHEADAFAEGVWTGTAPHPAMSPADSLGNMQTLDRWRQACGLTYDFEKAAGFPTVTISGEPLTRPAEPEMTYDGTIDGLDKPLSRLVMGCDNQTTLPHAAVMFDDYFARGGNAFDTAHLYGGGLQERLLGEWMKLRGVRDECVLLCKGVHTPYNFPNIVGVELARSLERLQTDHAEIYLCHRDNEQVPVDEWVDALNEQADAGRVKHFGGSNWSLDRVRAFNEYAKQHGKRPMTVVSNNLSLARLVEPMWPGCLTLHDDRWNEWRDYLVEQKIAHLAWSSQARGFFVPERDLSEEEIDRCWVSDDNLERRRRTFELAERKGVAPINIATAWVLQQPFTSFALFGPRSLAETRTSLPALRLELSPEERAWLNLERDLLP